MPTLHLIGPGQVGRAFLQQVLDLPVTVVAITDTSGTVFDRRGVPVGSLVQHSLAGRALADWPRAERIAPELAMALVAADIAVDASAPTPAVLCTAVERARGVLRNGASLVLASPHVLAAAPMEWIVDRQRARVGFAAALGGLGRQLVLELPELRLHCRSISLAGDPATTAIVHAIEGGASVDAALARLPHQGCDLAVARFVAIWSTVFAGDRCKAARPSDVVRAGGAPFSPELLRERAARGASTRLVARGGVDSTDLRIAFEEVATGSPLAAPADRLVAVYEMPQGLRVHTGVAVGHERAAAALLDDVRAALAVAEVRR